jgi:hypothetical protein
LEPFFVLVFLAGLVVANLLLRLLLGLRRGLRGHPFERRWPFLPPVEQRLLIALDQAAGRHYRVLARVALAAVMQPEQDLRRRQRRLAGDALGGHRVDFLVCSAVDCFPLCAVVVRSEDKRRAERRADAFVTSACNAAGLPVVPLTLSEDYDLDALRLQLRDAIETAGVAMMVAEKEAEPEPADEYEEAALAGLAASMKTPDDLTGAPPMRR